MPSSASRGESSVVLRRDRTDEECAAAAADRSSGTSLVKESGRAEEASQSASRAQQVSSLAPQHRDAAMMEEEEVEETATAASAEPKDSGHSARLHPTTARDLAPAPPSQFGAKPGDLVEDEEEEDEELVSMGESSSEAYEKVSRVNETNLANIQLGVASNPRLASLTMDVLSSETSGLLGMPRSPSNDPHWSPLESAAEARGKSAAPPGTATEREGSSPSPLPGAAAAQGGGGGEDVPLRRRSERTLALRAKALAAATSSLRRSALGGRGGAKQRSEEDHENQDEVDDDTDDADDTGTLASHYADVYETASSRRGTRSPSISSESHAPTPRSSLIRGSTDSNLSVASSSGGRFELASSAPFKRARKEPNHWREQEVEAFKAVLEEMGHERGSSWEKLSNGINSRIMELGFPGRTPNQVKGFHQKFVKRNMTKQKQQQQQRLALVTAAAGFKAESEPDPPPRSPLAAPGGSLMAPESSQHSHQPKQQASLPSRMSAAAPSSLAPTQSEGHALTQLVPPLQASPIVPYATLQSRGNAGLTAPRWSALQPPGSAAVAAAATSTAWPPGVVPSASSSGSSSPLQMNMLSLSRYGPMSASEPQGYYVPSSPQSQQQQQQQQQQRPPSLQPYVGGWQQPPQAPPSQAPQPGGYGTPAASTYLNPIMPPRLNYLQPSGVWGGHAPQPTAQTPPPPNPMFAAAPTWLQAPPPAAYPVAPPYLSHSGGMLPRPYLPFYPQHDQQQQHHHHQQQQQQQVSLAPSASTHPKFMPFPALVNPGAPFAIPLTDPAAIPTAMKDAVFSKKDTPL